MKAPPELLSQLISIPSETNKVVSPRENCKRISSFGNPLAKFARQKSLPNKEPTELEPEPVPVCVRKIWNLNDALKKATDGLSEVSKQATGMGAELLWGHIWKTLAWADNISFKELNEAADFQEKIESNIRDMFHLAGIELALNINHEKHGNTWDPRMGCLANGKSVENRICCNRIFGASWCENLSVVNFICKCGLVSYCSKNCQLVHWNEHHECCLKVFSNFTPPFPKASLKISRTSMKDFCVSPCGKYVFKPSILLIDSQNTYINIPATNILQNTPIPASSVSLLFNGVCGDFRHVIASTNSLPTNFNHPVVIETTDSRSYVVTRNLLITLFLASHCSSNNNINRQLGEAATHWWYSDHVTTRAMDVLIDTVAATRLHYASSYDLSSTDSDVQVTVVDVPVHISFAITKHPDDSELDIIEWTARILHITPTVLQARFSRSVWRDVKTVCLELETSMRHTDKYRMARLHALGLVGDSDDLKRQAAMNNYLFGLRPAHREAVFGFYDTGCLVPFGFGVAMLNRPNRLKVKGSAQQIEFMVDETTDPMQAWPAAQVFKPANNQSPDVFGTLYFHLQQQHAEFAHRLHEIKITFVFHVSDVSEIPASIPVGQKFTRVLSHGDSPGPPTTPLASSLIRRLSTYLDHVAPMPQLITIHAGWGHATHISTANDLMAVHDALQVANNVVAPPRPVNYTPFYDALAISEFSRERMVAKEFVHAFRDRGDSFRKWIANGCRVSKFGEGVELRGVDGSVVVARRSNRLVATRVSLASQLEAEMGIGLDLETWVEMDQDVFYYASRFNQFSYMERMVEWDAL
ncbi:hypothetical protein HK096_005916 [Nowakowskiella sp. JEL0078]|nr:hypothetical protein HK096_005916 [Nowakowskiella sp. JEL0078]